MKEATGELNMTVVTVIAIAAVAAIVTVFVLPTIRTQIKTKTCNSAGWEYDARTKDCSTTQKYTPTSDEG